MQRFEFQFSSLFMFALICQGKNFNVLMWNCYLLGIQQNLWELFATGNNYFEFFRNSFHTKYCKLHHRRVNFDECIGAIFDYHSLMFDHCLVILEYCYFQRNLNFSDCLFPPLLWRKNGQFFSILPGWLLFPFPLWLS